MRGFFVMVRVDEPAVLVRTVRLIQYVLVLTGRGTQCPTCTQTNRLSLCAVSKDNFVCGKGLGLRRSPRRISASEHTSSRRPVSRECNYPGNYHQLLPHPLA